jgi:translation initiation factor 1 (eIF-1/SUI1)
VAGHEELVATLKGVFGVGVRREEGAIVLQGDQVARLLPWLEAAGARVIRG